MNNYKQKLKRQLPFVIVAIIASAILTVLNLTGKIYSAELKATSEFIRGIQLGLSLVLLIFLLIRLIRDIQALTNDTHLKKRYIEANDERKKHIHQTVGGTPLLAAAVIIMLTGLAVSSINLTVSLTLLACACFLIFIRGTLKIYCKIKY